MGTILEAFDIKYMPHTFIKGQILADLVLEFAKSLLEEEVGKSNEDGKSIDMVSLQEPFPWRVYVDDAANQRGSGVGLVLISLEKITIEEFLRLSFSTINNEDEYEALLVGTTMVQILGSKAVEIFLDSRLVVG